MQRTEGGKLVVHWLLLLEMSMLTRSLICPRTSGVTSFDVGYI